MKGLANEIIRRANAGGSKQLEGLAAWLQTEQVSVFLCSTSGDTAVSHVSLQLRHQAFLFQTEQRQLHRKSRLGILRRG